MSKNLILFGAGNCGMLALEKYGTDKVKYFCDNALEKQGTCIKGIKVISFKEMIQLYHEGEYVIMVTPANSTFLIGQLESEGIFDYLIFRSNVDQFFLKELEDAEKKYLPENQILEDFVRRASKQNLLENVSEFVKLSSEALQKHKEENFTLGYNGYQGITGENHFYGYMKSIAQSGGVSKENLKYFPIVSHAIYVPVSAFGYRSAVIVPGNYMKRKIHERHPYVPVFTFGPYIHYAKGIYDKHMLKKEKEKCGKMLLAFLPHTTESGVKAKINIRNFVDRLLEQYKYQYSNIWLCVYWADLDDLVYEYAESKGIHVVTAGFRWDESFDSRLKTMLEMSDAVVCGDVGAFLSYAIYMGKPIGRVDCGNYYENFINSKSFQERKMFMIEDAELNRSFCKLFNDELKSTEDQKRWMDDSSGFDLVRDRDYIANVSEISKNIWIQAEGNLAKYPEAVRSIYLKYDKSGDIDKMAILKDAVGAYVD